MYISLNLPPYGGWLLPPIQNRWCFRRLCFGLQIFIFGFRGNISTKCPWWLLICSGVGEMSIREKYVKKIWSINNLFFVNKGNHFFFFARKANHFLMYLPNKIIVCLRMKILLSRNVHREAQDHTVLWNFFMICWGMFGCWRMAQDETVFWNFWIILE